MVEVSKHMPSLNAVVYTLVSAAVANAALFGLAGKVKQLPTTSINAAFASAAAGSVAALLGQVTYNAFLRKDDYKEENTWTQLGLKAGVIALFVFAANFALTVPVLKQKVGLDIRTPTAFTTAAFSTLGITTATQFAKPKFNGNFSDKHGELVSALTTAQTALAGASEGENKTAAQKTFDDAKKDYDTFVKAHSFSKDEAKAIKDFRESVAYTNKADK